MEDKKHPAKNNYSSSSFLKRNNLNSFQNENNNEFKENLEKISNSNPCEKYSESQKQNNITLSLEQFMENQNKKHLTTKFSHKDVEIFLKEKDKAMEEIIINEEINNENEKNENKNDTKNNNKNSNKSSQNLIFHGTFGKDEYDRIMNKEHHHHRHRHHHHHHKNNLENDSSKKTKEDKNKIVNIPLKC